MKLVLLSGAHSHTVGYLKEIRESADMDLLAVWDDMPSRGQAIADDMGCPFTADLDEAIGTPGVEAACVCADNAGHRPLVEAALTAGLDVFCEKPMALTVDDADAMVAAARQARRRLVLGYMQPYTGAMVAVRDLLAEGAIGTINQVRYRNAHHAAYGRWFDTPDRQWFHDPAKAGGGAFLDMGTHAVHLLLTLFGPIANVSAIIANKSGVYPAVDDFGTALVEFADGTTGVIEASWVLTGGRRGLEVLGSAGAIYASDRVELVRWADNKAAAPEVVKAAQAAPARLQRLLAIRRGEVSDQVAEQDMVACRDAVAVMCAAYESSRTGVRQVV